MKTCLVVAVLVTVVCLAGAQKYHADARQRNSEAPECGDCDRAGCARSSGCLAGLVRDECGCCDVCGKTEYELCDHPQVPSKDGAFRGSCGDNLECMRRKDLAEDEGPEAICYCKITGVLCGSDNVTYDNICGLMEGAMSNGKKVTVSSKGACHQVPVIVNPPEHAKDKLGANVALACEAQGFPIPTVEWTWTRVDGKTVYLPSDDLRVSVNMRGGPERSQVTGWLQIMELHKDHEGDYTCIVHNEHGTAEASARINVVDEGYNQKKPHKV